MSQLISELGDLIPLREIFLEESKPDLRVLISLTVKSGYPIWAGFLRADVGFVTKELLPVSARHSCFKPESCDVLGRKGLAEGDPRHAIKLASLW